MTTLPTPVLLAQIGAAHGIKGEVRVKAFTGEAEAIGDYGSLYSLDGRKFKITRMRPAKSVMIVKFKGVNTREEAEALNRLELFVDRSALPDEEDEDEFYVTDLIGCDVVDLAGVTIGRVHGVPDFGAGDLLEIAPAAFAGSASAGGGKSQSTWFLEFSRANVPDIDLANRKLTVVLPDEVSEREEQSISQQDDTNSTGFADH